MGNSRQLLKHPLFGFGFRFSWTEGIQAGSALNSTPMATPPLARVWAAYNRGLVERPVLTKAVTSAVLAAGGDVCAQRLTHRGAVRAARASDAPAPAFAWDGARTARLALLGFCFTGPTVHHWYGLLERWRPGATRAALLSKVLADQALFAPLITGAYFAAEAVLRGTAPGPADSVRQRLPSTLLVGYTIWPAANFINFRFTPLPLRAPASSLVAFFWNIYLSNKAASGAAGA